MMGAAAASALAAVAVLWLAVVVLPAHASAQKEDPHARAARLVAQMTLDEKLGFIQGDGHDSTHGSYVGRVPGLPRLGIPDLLMNDGAASGVPACVRCCLRCCLPSQFSILKYCCAASGWGGHTVSSSHRATFSQPSL
jgi:hypothetical protein